MEMRKKLLDDLYNNPKSPASFTGVNTLYKFAKIKDPKITLKDVERYLEAHRTYTLHKPRRINFKRRRTIPTGYMTDVDYQSIACRKMHKKH
jgi:hypothetical protein